VPRDWFLLVKMLRVQPAKASVRFHVAVMLLSFLIMMIKWNLVIGDVQFVVQRSVRVFVFKTGSSVHPSVFFVTENI